MASEILQGDPTDPLNKVQAKLDDVHAALSRANGTQGVIVTEPKLEMLIDAVRELTEEVRRIRDEDTGMGSGGLHVFDQ